MAILQGVGPHSAFLNVGGGSFPIEHGTVEQHGERQASTFSADVPMSFPGALETIATASTASIFVSSLAGSGTLVSGELDTVEIDYIARTVIRVSGRDEAAKLNDEKSSEKWTNKLGSDCVEDLCSRIGLGVDADSSSLLAGKMTQQDYAKVTDGISFASVIHKLAELDGARWWVKNGTLFYKIGGNTSGAYTINYQPPPIVSDCLRLVVTRNVQASKDVNVTVSSWHPKKKQVFTGNASFGGVVNGVINYFFHVPNLLQDHADGHANAKVAEISRNAVTVEAEVIGDPSIDVGMGLQLNGTGLFDGSYEIDVIRHEFGMQGYTMTITAKGAH